MMMDRPMTLEVIVSYRYISETVGSYAGNIGLYTGLGHVIGVDEIEIKWFCREHEMMTKCENRGVSGRTDRTNLSACVARRPSKFTNTLRCLKQS